MENQPNRMLIEGVTPTKEEIEKFIGNRAASHWKKLVAFLDSSYSIVPDTVFYGKKYGWTVRYRKSGKTLCSLFPEVGGFTILIVLGKAEVEKVTPLLDELSNGLRNLYLNTEQLRDGRWLWIRVPAVASVEDIKMLLRVKRKPKQVI